MFQRIKQAKSDESGFSLIELLVVIIILGILAGIVVFAVGGINDRGQTAACKADKKTIRVAQEAHFARSNPGTYAADAPALVTAKLLSEDSEWYSTTGAPTGGPYTSYTIAPKSGSPCT